MTRPDPANLPASLAYIMDGLDALRAARDAERVGPTEAARLLGYPRGYLSPSAHPERTPDFGARGTLHALGTWRAWNEVPDGQRLREWDALTLRQRTALRGLERREA